MQPEYNLLMGESKMNIGLFREALQYFSNVIKSRPRNISGWEAIIRCLYKNNLFEEALVQSDLALKATNRKPLFLFYRAAVLLAMTKNKEAILQLENALSTAPRLLKKFVELNQSALKNQQVVEILAKFKRKRTSR